MRKYSSLFHLALHVSDMQRSIDYYTRVGADFMFTLKLPDGRDWLTYMRIAKGQYLELFQIYEDHPMTPHGPINLAKNDVFGHLSFSVKDLKEAATEWAKNGIELIYAPFHPMDRPIPLDNFDARRSVDGCIIGWLVDPDGNKIEVMQQDDSMQQQFERANPYED